MSSGQIAWQPHSADCVENYAPLRPGGHSPVAMCSRGAEQELDFGLNFFFFPLPKLIISCHLALSGKEAKYPSMSVFWGDLAIREPQRAEKVSRVNLNCEGQRVAAFAAESMPEQWQFAGLQAAGPQGEMLVLPLLKRSPPA